MALLKYCNWRTNFKQAIAAAATAKIYIAVAGINVPNICHMLCDQNFYSKLTLDMRAYSIFRTCDYRHSISADLM